MTFSDMAKRLMARAGLSIAKDERGDRGPQPVEVIPGMTSAPEPCLLFDRWHPDKHPRNSIVEPKIDGIRALYVQGRIVTRQALPLDAALHCLPALDRLEKRMGAAMVFDGEYQEPEGFAATLAAHKRGEGCGTFYLFDAVPLAEWKANAFTQPLAKRKAALALAVSDEEPFLAYLSGWDGGDASVVERLAEKAWTAEHEGLVVKDALSLYCRGRSSAWSKIKRVQTFDGPVLDVIVKGDDSSTAVALVRLDGKTVKVAAMDNHLKELALTDAVMGSGGLTGRMVEVAFDERTETGALRGARIVRLRPDKEEGER